MNKFIKSFELKEEYRGIKPFKIDFMEGNKPCYECVLLSGPMCLDRRYCQFRETGLTWKKCINQSELDNSEY